MLLNAFFHLELEVNQYMRQTTRLNLYFPVGMFVISRTFLFVLGNIRAKGEMSMY